MSEEGEGSPAEAAAVGATVGDSAPESGTGETVSETGGEETSPSEKSNGPDFVGTFEEPDYTQFEDLGGDEILPGADDSLDPPEFEEVAAAETQTPEEKVEEKAKAEDDIKPTESPEVKAEIVPPEPVALETSDPTAEEISAARNEGMSQILDSLETHYKFSEEEAAKINDVDSKPSDYLPRLLAMAHRNALLQSNALMQKNVPDMVTATSKENIAASKAEDSFFGRWPALKGNEDKAFASIKAYKDVNPDADMEAVIEGAGTLAMVSLGKALETPAASSVSDIPMPPPPPAGTGGGTGETSRTPASYEERVFGEFVDEDQRIAKG